jgi:hypothetical protein
LQKELHNKTADNQSINPIRLKATPPNSTSGKNTSSTIAIEEEYNRWVMTHEAIEIEIILPTLHRLRKETNKLKSDLRAKELQLVNAQKNQKVCEEEMEALEIECKNKVILY